MLHRLKRQPRKDSVNGETKAYDWLTLHRIIGALKKVEASSKWLEAFCYITGSVNTQSERRSLPFKCYAQDFAARPSPATTVSELRTIWFSPSVTLFHVPHVMSSADFFVFVLLGNNIFCEPTRWQLTMSNSYSTASTCCETWIILFAKP